MAQFEKEEKNSSTEIYLIYISTHVRFNDNVVNIELITDSF